MITRKLKFTDHLEIDLATTFMEKGIDFIHESENKEQRLDFYLPNEKVYIEIKQYHSERTNEQLESQDEVILIQGKKALQYFKTLL
jgi:hypothetical protein